MTLKNLLTGIEGVKIIGDDSVEIKDVTSDSKTVGVGTLFICINGENTDSHALARQVEKYGAVALVVERKLDVGITQIVVDNTRRAMSIIASNLHGNPDKKLKIIAVTGTNGKTTTSHLIGKILNGCGIKCGVIGTLGTFYENKYLEPTLTTPDPLVLYKILDDMVKCGVQAVAMEASAHAIFYDKLEGLKFKVAIFTNLTHDHLDFFENLDNYKSVKKSLFLKNHVQYALINSDDSIGLELINEIDGALSYGIENPADVFSLNVKQKADCTEFVLNVFDYVYNAKIKLNGLFNVYNSMAAVGACSLLGAPVDKVVEQLELVNGIDGRLECVYDRNFSVFIDYAHTPDGLKSSLNALKKVCKGKLICVFGCGGNRDEYKRKIMGEISGEIADFTIITTDNPRFEDPMDIIWEIEKGVKSKTREYVIIQDRISAIEYSINFAKPKDVVIIAGKGSERYQEVFGIKKPYNDKDTVKTFLRELK
ncbi:MAG: UDP-N-acetylmuramoyl-L-alanyl-D-glutamate--2,6-diaminopimelate ligase [Clostridia bacterium]|nr:UDP-N-acetylmuramoyl-L-alanyl-D-glutamate--2,6-diaminopimelate ligase [Clostridia bacterium]